MAKHESHFIPSPFQTVTQYEDEFANAFKINLKSSIEEVLKMLATITKQKGK